MKNFKFILILFFLLFCISNAFAGNERCRKIFNSSIPERTIYSDYNQASYYYQNGSAENCKCTIRFNLQSDEKYIGTVFNGKILDLIELSSEHASIANNNNYWDRDQLRYYKFWSNTLNYLASFVDKNNRCPNEDEYQELKSVYLEDKNSYKKMIDSKREEESSKNKLYEQEKNIRLNLVRKFCNGVPKINLIVIENISSVVKVDPQLIKLNRVNIADDGYCFATFHTPKGVVVVWVDFNQNGVITSNGKIFYN